MRTAERTSAQAAGLTSLAATLAAALTLGAPTAAMATKLVVGNCLDNVPGSLRATVGSALDMDTVDLSQVAPCTITLTNGAIAIGVNNLTLTAGPGSKNAVTIDGGLSANYHNRVFTHTKTGTLTIEGLKITDAKYNSGPETSFKGGCISSKGSVRLVGSTVSGCEVYDFLGAMSGVYGGGVAADSVYLSDSTVSKNTAHATSTHFASGGGIYARHVTLAHSVVSGNSAVADSAKRAMGGGVVATDNLDVSYSTISANLAQIDGGLHLYASISPYSNYGAYFARISNSTISGNSFQRQHPGQRWHDGQCAADAVEQHDRVQRNPLQRCRRLYVTCPYDAVTILALHRSCRARSLPATENSSISVWATACR